MNESKLGLPDVYALRQNKPELEKQRRKYITKEIESLFDDGGETQSMISEQEGLEHIIDTVIKKLKEKHCIDENSSDANKSEFEKEYPRLVIKEMLLNYSKDTARIENYEKINIQEVGKKYLERRNSDALDKLKEILKNDIEGREALQLINYVFRLPVFVIALEKFQEAGDMKEKLIVLGISAAVGKLLSYANRKNKDEINKLREGFEKIA